MGNVTDLWAQVYCSEAGVERSGAGSLWRGRRAAGRSLQPPCRKVRKALMRGLRSWCTLTPVLAQHQRQLWGPACHCSTLQAYPCSVLTGHLCGDTVYLGLPCSLY